MARSVLAVDIDLRRIHAWGGPDEEVLFVDASLPQAIARLFPHRDCLVLIEVAGVIMHGENKDLQRKQAWALWNIMAATTLFRVLPHEILVASSTKWTRSNNEETRHLIAKAEDEPGFTKDQNHNIKECKAMVAFHRIHPAPWVPLEEYFRCL